VEVNQATANARVTENDERLNSLKEQLGIPWTKECGNSTEAPQLSLCYQQGSKYGPELNMIPNELWPRG